jgi:hypothetical protein
MRRSIAEGNVVATEFLATRDELDAFRLANEGATIRKAVAPREAVLRDVGGTLYDVTNPANPRIVIPGEGPAPVLQNVGGTLYNVTDPANPQVVVPGEGPAPVLQNVCARDIFTRPKRIRRLLFPAKARPLFFRTLVGRL